MREQWLDEHVGDETVARPGFRAELRSALADELAAPARTPRHIPWKPVLWSAAAAAALVGAIAVMSRDDGQQRITASPTTVAATAPATTAPTTTPDTVSGSTTSAPSTVAPPPGASELLVPATGGRDLTPEVIATPEIAVDHSGPHVALLPDRSVVLPSTGGLFDGTVVSVDRDGNPLPDTRLDAVPDGQAGLVLGGFDGTLYVETFAGQFNTQTTRAYTLDGEVWREVDSFVVEQNNDGVYQVTGAGLQLGSEVVIPAQSVIEDGATAALDSYTPPTMQFSRSIPNGVTTTWRVVQAHDAVLFPPTPLFFGDGLLFRGDTDDAQDAGEFVGILRASGDNEYFRLNGWSIAGADDAAALFVQVVDGTVQLGVLAA